MFATEAFPLLRLIWRRRPDVILSGTAELNFLALLLQPFFPLGTRISRPAERDGIVCSLFWGSSPLHALALPPALPACRRSYLPIARDGRRL